jgi:hypothetical protein
VDEWIGSGYSKPLVEWCLRALPAVTAPGWFTCYCGCGYVGVCRHCVPDAPMSVPWQLCPAARLLVATRQYRCRGGWIEEVVSDA